MDRPVKSFRWTLVRAQTRYSSTHLGCWSYPHAYSFELKRTGIHIALMHCLVGFCLLISCIGLTWWTVDAIRFVDIDIDEAMERVEKRHVSTGKCNLPKPCHLLWFCAMSLKCTYEVQNVDYEDYFHFFSYCLSRNLRLILMNKSDPDAVLQEKLLTMQNSG